MKLLFFDLETTGFGFEKCSIIQLAAIMVDIDAENKLKPLGAINLKMRPRIGKMIDQRSLEVNGYSVDEIMSWKDDHEAYKEFIAFLDKYIDKYDTLNKAKLCGYNNSHFDNDFLRQWFYENGDKFFGSYFYTESIDVMCEASRYLMHYRPAMINFKLGNVASVLGIELDKSALHDGLYDIKVTYKVFKKILESGNIIMPFDETTATTMFNDQQVAKSQEHRKKSAFTEENAWITVE